MDWQQGASAPLMASGAHKLLVPPIIYFIYYGQALMISCCQLAATLAA
jgi:hypothetical protein